MKKVKYRKVMALINMKYLGFCTIYVTNQISTCELNIYQILRNSEFFSIQPFIIKLEFFFTVVAKEI